MKNFSLILLVLGLFALMNGVESRSQLNTNVGMDMSMDENIDFIYSKMNDNSMIHPHSMIESESESETAMDSEMMNESQTESMSESEMDAEAESESEVEVDVDVDSNNENEGPILLPKPAPNRPASAAASSSQPKLFPRWSPGVFSPQVAQQLKYFSQTAYCPQTSLFPSWNCLTCKLESLGAAKSTAAAYYPAKNLYGYVATVKDTQNQIQIVTTFRGTVAASLSNWGVNFDGLVKTDFGKPGSGKVHDGFLDGFRALQPTISAALKDARRKFPQARLIFTGHSLGGALATMAAAHFSTVYPSNIVTLYTYGSPRVGDQKFQIWLNQRVVDSYRIVHFKDAIPHVPPHLMGYRHVGDEIFYPDFGHKYTRCGRGENKKCSNQFNFNINDGIADHSLYMNSPMNCNNKDVHTFLQTSSSTSISAVSSTYAKSTTTLAQTSEQDRKTIELFASLAGVKINENETLESIEKKCDEACHKRA